MRWMRALAVAPAVVLGGLAACTEKPADDPCGRLAAAWSIDDVPDGRPCDAPPAPRDLAAADRIAVAVYHFNLQYVAGGLQGFLGSELPEWDEAAVEDLIIRVGLEPVLDIYLDHPSFHSDIEMQAYMLEVIAARHPDVLDKIRTLAARGQIAFDSFHYSDQLYVAYPRRDMEVSLDLTQWVFERLCVPLGRSVFTQEGQFARGQLDLAAERGYRVSLIPRNLFKEQFGDAAANASVLYEDPRAPGHSVLIGGQSWAGGGVELRSMFMDDGEIALTKNELNPYFATIYEVDPNRVAQRIADMQALEAQGYVLATIEEAVAALRARGILPAPMPPSLDGTWQPANTGNVFRWMGGAGLFVEQERDSDVLAAIWRARRAVADATQRHPGAPGASAAWRELLFAQVSDSTGWNPFSGEVSYSFEHAEGAEALARDLHHCEGTSPAQVGFDCAPAGTVDPASLGIAVSSPARAFAVTAAPCTGSGESVYRVQVELPAISANESEGPDNYLTEVLERTLEVRVDVREHPLAVIGALEATPRPIDLDDYVFPTFGIPLPVGVLGLGGGRWIIQDHATGRLAALLSQAPPDRDVVLFRDETTPRSTSATRTFYVVEGASADAATSLAAAINGPL